MTGWRATSLAQGLLVASSEYCANFYVELFKHTIYS